MNWKRYILNEKMSSSSVCVRGISEKTKNNLKNKQKRNKNQSGCEPLNLENISWKGVTRHCSSRKYLWCEGSLAFELNKPMKPFSIQGCVVIFAKWKRSTLRNCLLLRPAYTFYITCICTCPPCAVVKNGKIILFGQKWDIDWAKYLSLRYVKILLIFWPLR